MGREEFSALLAAVGVLDALYLTLYKMGWVGSVVCVTGEGCAIVQSSPYAEFLGLPTAFWGLLFYGLFLVLALIRVEREDSGRWLNRALWGLALWGVLFATYLTGVELFVIHAICTWCVVSWGIVILLFVLETLGLRKGEIRRGESRQAAAS